jgi:hypothetical protein
MKTLAALLVLIAPLFRASPGSCLDHDFLVETETVRAHIGAATKSDKSSKSSAPAPAPAPAPRPKQQPKQERTPRPAPPAHLFM